jgi:RHS repeat-associated protein
MTDSTGSKVNRYVYDPYGTIISQQEQSGLNNPWKFAAGYLDSSTGLYKFGTRYDDPTLGRWTQLDSAGTGYVYAGDDPVNMVDPSGKSIFSFLNCLGGWVGGLITVFGIFVIITAIAVAIIGAITTLNPLIRMFIFMATVLAFAAALGIMVPETWDHLRR